MKNSFFVQQVMLAIATSLILCIPSFAQLNENFDSYNLGSIDGQGPWVDFGGTLPPEVSNDRAVSGDKSLKLSQNPVGVPDIPGYGADVFTDLPSGIRSGTTQLSYSIYVPSDFDGTAHTFVSEGAVGAGEFDFGMQLVADRIQGFQIFFDGVQAFGLPLVTDQWMEVNSTIDLDNNVVNVTYGGDILYIGPWDPDPADGFDRPTLRGVNLWAQDGVGTGAVYIDDFKIVPEPSGILLVVCGMVGGAVRMRRRR